MDEVGFAAALSAGLDAEGSLSRRINHKVIILRLMANCIPWPYSQKNLIARLFRINSLEGNRVQAIENQSRYSIQ
jgi:hypothetical protein